MTPVELDAAQRWAARLAINAEIRTTSGPNGKAWRVVGWNDEHLILTRTPGRRIQHKKINGDQLIAAYRATRGEANKAPKAPPRLRYTP